MQEYSSSHTVHTGGAGLPPEMQFRAYLASHLELGRPLVARGYGVQSTVSSGLRFPQKATLQWAHDQPATQWTLI